MRFSLCLVALTLTFANAATAQETKKNKEYERILTEEDFVKEVVGKSLSYDSGAVVIFLEDRTFGGGFSGSQIWGEWVWREDRLCHQFNVGEKRYKVTCKIPQLGDEKIRFIREDGSSYGIADIN